MLSQSLETAVAYTIVFLNGAAIVGSTPWPGDLSSAKQHAMDHFAINRSQRGATEVVVLDDDDRTKKVVFSYRGPQAR
jgi:hypothetical protein